MARQKEELCAWLSSPSPSASSRFSSAAPRSSSLLRMLPPPPLKSDSASTFQPLSALGDSCSSPILEPDRSALLQEALADSQLQAVKAQLEARGLSINIDEAQAVQLVGGEQLLIPFGENAHLVWTRAKGQSAAVGLIRSAKGTRPSTSELMDKSELSDSSLYRKLRSCWASCARRASSRSLRGS